MLFHCSTCWRSFFSCSNCSMSMSVPVLSEGWVLNVLVHNHEICLLPDCVLHLGPLQLRDRESADYFLLLMAESVIHVCPAKHCHSVRFTNFNCVAIASSPFQLSQIQMRKDYEARFPWVWVAPHIEHALALPAVRAYTRLSHMHTHTRTHTHSSTHTHTYSTHTHIHILHTAHAYIHSTHAHAYIPTSARSRST